MSALATQRHQSSPDPSSASGDVALDADRPTVEVPRPRARSRVSRPARWRHPGSAGPTSSWLARATVSVIPTGPLRICLLSDGSPQRYAWPPDRASNLPLLLPQPLCQLASFNSTFGELG